MQQEFFQSLAVYATPVLLAVITFFLRSLLARFTELEREVKAMLVKHEGFEQRIVAMEARLRDAMERVEVLQDHVWGLLKK